MSSDPSDKPVHDADALRAGSGTWRLNRMGRRRDAVELAVGYALIVTGLWMPRGPDTWFYWAALVWIIVTTALAFPGWRALGLHGRGFLPSLWIVALALAVAVAGFAIGGAYHSLNQRVRLAPVFHRYWAYSIWALVQEFLLLDFFLLRLCRLVPGNAWAVGLLAVLFATAHIPNPVLAPLTLVWGGIAGVVFLRYRNLYTLGLAHAILGICVAITVPSVMDHHMRVGLGYLNYHPHHRNVNDSTTHNTIYGGL